jgi:hypothetical protein
VKNIITAILFILFVLTAASVAAQIDKKMAVGAYFGAGFSFAAGDGPENVYLLKRDNRSGKFSGAFGAYFDFNFTPAVALETGMGFDSQGVRWTDNDDYFKVRHFYMEIPVMVRMNVSHFVIGAGIQFSFALSGKDKADNGIVSSEEKWDDNDWKYFHRVNIGPKLLLGYAISLGLVTLVPSISWSIHLVNDINSKKIEDDLPGIDRDQYKSRYNNLLFNIAAEFGF